jgi:hypothetical protein
VPARLAINGRATCIDSRSRDRVSFGRSVEPLVLVAACPEASTIFSEQAQAAPASAEVVTRDQRPCNGP